MYYFLCQLSNIMTLTMPYCKYTIGAYRDMFLTLSNSIYVESGVSRH